MDPLKRGGRGARTVCAELVLQFHHDRIVPGEMEILFRWRNLHRLTSSAPVAVAGGVQGLVDVAHKVDQKGQVAGRSPFIVVAVF